MKLTITPRFQVASLFLVLGLEFQDRGRDYVGAHRKEVAR